MRSPWCRQSEKVSQRKKRKEKKRKENKRKERKENKLIDTNYTYVIFGKNNVYKDKFENVLNQVNETFKKINKIENSL